MKKLLAVVVSIALLSTACFADDGDGAKLRMRISGPINDNRYFLCVSNIGCVSILAGNRGKVYPMEEGNVDRIFTVDSSNMRMFNQPLPASCNVKVNSGQTMTVSGTLLPQGGSRVILSNLHCSVG